MDIRESIGDFIFRTRELSQQLRSDESMTVNTDDLDTLRVQLYLLDSEVANLRNFLLQTRSKIDLRKQHKVEPAKS